MWEPQARALEAAGWRVIVPDLPGFGRSRLLEQSPDLDTVGALIAGHLDVAGIDRCVLGGISLGGYVAMTIARTRPDLVAGMMLVDTKATADSDQARENRERLAAMCLAAPEESGRILEQAVLPGLLGDTTRGRRLDVLARVTEWIHEADANAVAWYQRAMAGRPDSLPVLAGMTAPGLVIWGDEDAISTRSDQDVMVRTLADGDLAVIAHAGHLSNVEDPVAVSDAMRRFLAVVRGPQTS
jgi:pimeloyl-ACP methyl ester carboxylesterase